MIVVYGISADWCNKCKQAKKKLEGYDDLIWLDYKGILGKHFYEKYEIEHMPVFLIVENNTITREDSVIGVKKLLEEV